MANTAVVDFNLSDVPVFSTENSVFNLVVVSALSLIGINQLIFLYQERKLSGLYFRTAPL